MSDKTKTPDDDSLKRLVAIDDDGCRTYAGDKVSFSYGIPPVHVVGDVIATSGCLIVLTPGHKPESCLLRSLRQYVGGWFKHNNPTP
jgi:hypothetical protein